MSRMRRVYLFSPFRRTAVNVAQSFQLNDAFNTFYLRLYGVGHMVKDHLDSERENPLPATWAILFD